MIGHLPPPSAPRVETLDDVKLWLKELWAWHTEMEDWFRLVQTTMNDAVRENENVTVGNLTVSDLTITGALAHQGSTVGYYGATPVSQPDVSGSSGANAALQDLLTEMDTRGDVTDSST